MRSRDEPRRRCCRYHRLRSAQEGQSGGSDHCRPSRSSRRTQAFEAGASLAHIHVRNDDETPSSDPERFAAVQEGMRKHCPGMIVQFSTGGRGRDPSARGHRCICKPDMASLVDRIGELSDDRLREPRRPWSTTLATA